MVSKNNRIKRMEEAAERQSHFGIRKLTVGAASVLLGITLLFGANAKVARADETNAQTGTSAVETKVTTGASAAESDNNKGKKTNQSSTDVHVLDSNESTTINNGENEAKGVTQKTTSMVAVKTRQSNKQALDIAKTTGASAQPNVNTSATQGADTKQGENPDWYMTDPSKATDENAARENLEQAIAYAKAHPIKGLDIKGEQDAEGRITVAPDPKKENEVKDANDAITIAYDNEKDSAQYMQSIANKIWDEIKTYEAYEAERETFMDGLAAEGLYNPKTDVDPTTLSQHLTLDSEPDAIVNLEIKDNNGNWITATKNGLENGLEIDKLETKGNGLLTIDNATDKSDKSDLDTMGSKRGWTVTFKKNGPVNDPFIRLTFTNLKNSHYDDGTNAAVVPIDKIVETFSDVHSTDGDPAKFLFASDPTRGWWYNHCSGVTATIQLYGEYDKTDKDGKVEKEEKLITLNQPVYMSVSSLNSGGEKSLYKESAELESDGEAYRIPESSVIANNKKLYSPYYNNWYLDGKKDTNYYNYWGGVFEPDAWKGATDEKQKVENLGKHIVETYKGWDNPDQYNRIFGSGLYKVNGDKIIVRSYVGGSKENQSISKYNHVWFAYSTIIPKTTFDAKHPGTTINYHFAKAIKQHAVVNYLDSDEGNKQITTSGDLTGPAGAKIDYNTKQTIDDLEREGYELVYDGFPKDSVFDHDKTTTQTYEVILKHAHITVTPDKPGNGLDRNTLTKTVTEKVNYVVDGGKVQAPAAKDASLTFKGTAYYDAVTKKWTDASGKELTDQTKNITWTAQDGHHFGVVVSPEVKGYHVANVSGNYNDGNGNVKAINDITENSNNITVTVHYTPNGKIIPVDPSGKPIPNVPTPTYPTDPKDPMKVVPDEPVPDVPGRTPEVSTVTPKDPSKDTPVVYTPVDTTQHAVVNYLDSDEGNKQITTSGDLTGPAGAKIVYNTKQTIDDLEGKGYELVRDGFPKDSVFDHDKTTTQTYEVILKHAHITVTPDKPGNGLDRNTLTKTVTEKVNYVVDGGKVQAPAAKDASLTFKGTAYYDAVTKKWTDASGKELTDQTKNITWTAQDGHHFGVVVSPEVKGYHVANVSGNYNDGNGNVKAINDITENSNNITVTVHYTPNGKIIPVDPSGKPIPNVPTPTYPTDPKDPMKVVPDEPVPDVPGRTPEVSTVTPKDPSKDTPVVYTPVDTTQHAVVNYLDSDEGNKQITTSGDLTGPAGAKIVYNTKQTIDDLEGKGYELVRDGFPKDSVFDHDKTTTQTYEVILKHAHITVTPDKPGDPKKPINPDDPKGPKYPEGTTKNDLTKDSTQTIIYHYSDGSKPDEKKTETYEDTFTRTKVVDKVTGEVIKTTPWTGSHTFDSKDVPVVNGYHSDKKTVGGKTATVNNPDVTDTVTYTPNGKIIPVDPSGKPIPNVPTPTYPTDPKDPTKVVPDEPVPDVPGRTPEASTVTPKDPSKDTPVVYNSIPNVPGPSDGPSDNTPTPVTPAPGKTTEEKKPDENKDDKDVNEPDDDEDVVPTPRHHKKHNGGESSTTRPRPTGYTPAPRGSGYLDANGKVHYKLPQTGESDSEEMAAVLGGAATAIGLIGLAGAKKRRHE